MGAIKLATLSEIIYHLTTQEAWDLAQLQGEYRAESLATEGFIHASTVSQVEGSANRFFTRYTSILLLRIRRELVTTPIVWEQSTHSENPFPHIYGPLNLDAILEVLIWSRDANSDFVLPVPLEPPQNDD